MYSVADFQVCVVLYICPRPAFFPLQMFQVSLFLYVFLFCKSMGLEGILTN